MHKPLWNVYHLLTRVVKESRSNVQQIKKLCRQMSERTVLGIETSCDDTGVAIVREDGTILGEAIHSQTSIHVEMGGIIPPVARDLHKQHIHQVVQLALDNAGITVHDVDAIATTVKPGLVMSLNVGVNYTKQLVVESRKPFIPIHHMEAHALTARMIHSVAFPFLVLLMSGGHCLLAAAKDVDEFYLLGQSLDVAPGDSYDKLSRELGLKNLPECRGLSGGAAVEMMAKCGNPRRYLPIPHMHHRFNCHFSFSGVRTYFERVARAEKEKIGDLPHESVSDICASFQYFILRHVTNRLQRALLYCHKHNLLNTDQATLVVSGGVASNVYLREGLQHVCDVHDTLLVCPPPELCTDNGIMIAWNGIEKLTIGRGVADINTVHVQPKCPLGVDVSADVVAEQIKVTAVKFHH